MIPTLSPAVFSDGFVVVQGKSFVVLHLSGKYSDKDINLEVWRAVAKSVVSEAFALPSRAAVPKRRRR